MDFVCHHAHAFAHDEEAYKSQAEARETSDSGEDIGYTADRARGTPRGMARPAVTPAHASSVVCAFKRALSTML